MENTEYKLGDTILDIVTDDNRTIREFVVDSDEMSGAIVWSRGFGDDSVCFYATPDWEDSRENGVMYMSFVDDSGDSFNFSTPFSYIGTNREIVDRYYRVIENFLSKVYP